MTRIQHTFFIIWIFSYVVAINSTSEHTSSDNNIAPVQNKTELNTTQSNNETGVWIKNQTNNHKVKIMKKMIKASKFPSVDRNATIANLTRQIARSESMEVHEVILQDTMTSKSPKSSSYPGWTVGEISVIMKATTQQANNKELSKNNNNSETNLVQINIENTTPANNEFRSGKVRRRKIKQQTVESDKDNRKKIRKNRKQKIAEQLVIKSQEVVPSFEEMTPKRRMIARKRKMRKLARINALRHKKRFHWANVKPPRVYRFCNKY